METHGNTLKEILDQLYLENIIFKQFVVSRGLSGELCEYLNEQTAIMNIQAGKINDNKQ